MRSTAELYIAGIKGQVSACPSASAEDQAKCKATIEASQKAKKARLQEQQEVRDAVITDVEDKEDAIGLDEIGSSQTRTVGPMDKFTRPLDPSSLAKKTHQPKISEHIMKDSLHRLKRYISRWLYIRAIPFNAINNPEFDQMLEAVGRFGPSAKKPY